MKHIKVFSEPQEIGAGLLTSKTLNKLLHAAQSLLYIIHNNNFDIINSMYNIGSHNYVHTTCKGSNNEHVG